MPQYRHESLINHWKEVQMSEALVPCLLLITVTLIGCTVLCCHLLSSLSLLLDDVVLLARLGSAIWYSVCVCVCVCV